MAYELGKNFQTSLVATAPSPATSGTSLAVTTGEGGRFDTPPFQAVVCPADAQATVANAEIVRVTALSTDTFTITRASEGSTARSIVVGDRIYVGPTVNTFAQILLEVATKRNNTNTVTTYLTLPIFEDNTTQTVAPFANDLPGINLTATGISIVHANLVMPADVVTANNFKVRMLLGAASGGNIRMEAGWMKVADAASLTSASFTPGTGQTVTLSANTLKVIDIVTSTVPSAAGALLAIRIYRAGDDGADTLAATAYLISAALVYDATI